MIEQIYIKNFKAYEDSSIQLEKDNIIIGETYEYQGDCFNVLFYKINFRDFNYN